MKANDAVVTPVTGVELILIRHGETEWNSQRRIQGQIDIGLNTLGERQAQATATRLQSERIDAVYTSDLARAARTAAPIAAAHGLVPVPDPRLRERHFGDFEGRFYEALVREQPARHQRMVARDLNFDLDGGETIPELFGRARAALDAYCDAHADGARLVVVSHGGVLDCAYRLATGLALDAPRDFGLYNASLNVIRRDSLGWHLVSWGDIEHLGGASDEIDPTHPGGPASAANDPRPPR